MHAKQFSVTLLQRNQLHLKDVFLSIREFFQLSLTRTGMLQKKRHIEPHVT